jgi:hypothetical protein
LGGIDEVLWIKKRRGKEFVQGSDLRSSVQTTVEGDNIYHFSLLYKEFIDMFELL